MMTLTLSSRNITAASGRVLGTVGLFWGAIALLSPAAFAQASPSIQAAPDNIGTTVTQQGNQFDITGGSTAGQNLFHSFEKFGLNSGEVANFLTNPDVQNVLGRVVGGQASIIDGQIRLSGSNANLFLMNPAGLVFGRNASLNVPGSFTATTANSIDFANGSFGALESVNLQPLSGDPAELSFVQANGSIINAGELTVAAGQSLSLAGKSVVNTGNLSAPGGSVTVAAIPDSNKIRISATGTVLGLGIEADALQANRNSSLSQLVVGASDSVATGVVVEPDGSIRLTASGQQVPVTAGTVVISGNIDVSSGSGKGGLVQGLGDRVALIDTQVNASGQIAGGTVLIGGDFQGRGELPNSSQTFVGPNSTITANAVAGDGGRVIVWSDGSTQFYGAIEARAGDSVGNGGFVEVSGLENLAYRGTVDTSATNGLGGTLLLDPTDIVITAGGADTGFDGDVLSAEPGPTTISQNQLQSLPGNTNILIQASNSITFEPLNSSGAAPIGIGGGMTIPSPSPALQGITFQPGSGTITFEAGGLFDLGTGNSLDPNGRDLTITAGTIVAGEIKNFDSIRNQSGSITLTATTGDITANLLSTGLDLQEGFDTRGNAAPITLNAANGNIDVGAISAISGIDGNGADVTISAPSGSFTGTTIETTATGRGTGGNVTIDAPGGISVNLIDAKAGNFGIPSGRGGTITLNGQVQGDSTIRNVAGAGAAVAPEFVGAFDTLDPQVQNLVRASILNNGLPFNTVRGAEALQLAQEHWDRVMRDVRDWDRRSSRYYYVGPGSN